MRRIAWTFAALLFSGTLAGACSRAEESSERPVSQRDADPVSAFVAASRTTPGAAVESKADHIARGLHALAGALESLELDDLNLPLDLRAASVHVILQPTSLEIAALTRDLALRVATVLATTGQMSDVRLRAEAIRATLPAVEQVAAIQAFFEAAGRAMQASDRSAFAGGSHPQPSEIQLPLAP